MSLTPPPDISYIVISWNTCRLLENCLRSIDQWNSLKAHEIIVVDNHSRDGSGLMVGQKFPSVRLIQNDSNLGFTRAVNQGLRASTGRFAFVLNSDVELLPGAVSTLCEVMEAHPRAGIATCAQQRPDGTAVVPFYDDPTLRREIIRNLFLTDFATYRLMPQRRLAKYHQPAPVDWVVGSALLVRREVISSVGLLDEAVFMYGEEFDWCYRARQQGWQVYYVPTAHILHHENQSGIQRFNTQRYSMVAHSLFYFYDKHFGIPRRRILAGAYVVGSLIRMAAWALLWLLPPLHPVAHAQMSEHRQTVQMAWRYLLQAQSLIT